MRLTWALRMDACMIGRNIAARYKVTVASDDSKLMSDAEQMLSTFTIK